MRAVHGQRGLDVGHGLPHHQAVARFPSRVDGVWALTGPSHRHPWEYKDGPYQQIGGYAIEFDVPGRFVFTTVRGGRHEVPETAPDRAFEMLKRFLNGEKF